LLVKPWEALLAVQGTFSIRYSAINPWKRLFVCSSTF